MRDIYPLQATKRGEAREIFRPRDIAVISCVKWIDSLFREFAIFACDLHFIECESWRKWKNLCTQNIVYLLPQRMNSEKTHTEKSERSTDRKSFVNMNHSSVVLILGN